MSGPGYIPSIVPELEPPSGQDSAATSGTSAAPAGSTPKPSRLGVGRSRLLAASLSFIWPGLGQLYARRFITAAIFAVPVVVAAIWLVMQVLNGVLYVGLSFLDASFALTFVIGGAFLGVWRIAAMIHAYVTTGPRRRPRVLDSAVLAILLIVVVAVHATVVYSSWLAYSFDVDLASNVLVNDQPTAAPGSQATATTSPTPLPWQPGGSYPPPNPTPVVAPSPAPSDRVTILLTGMDWLPGRTTSMNDAIMLVSFDTKTHKVAMISIPRDTADFDYYWGGSAGVNTKINNFANLVAKGLIHAPDPSLTAFANEVGFLVGIKVDYYAEMDMEGFMNLIDAAGGICLTVPKAVVDPSYDLAIAAGYQCIDGTTALKYARARHTSNDYARDARQQQLLTALAKKIASPSGIGRLPKLLSLASQIIQTNFPLNTAKNYVSLIEGIGTGDITNCVLGPPYDYHPATALTKGDWTSRLELSLVSGLSVYLFGSDSRYYGMQGVTPAPCASQY
jgi:LCP family protein required for cell wall assembly